MYRTKSQQHDEYKGAPAHADDDGRNDNAFKPILDDLLMGRGNSDEWTLLQHIAWLDPEFTAEVLLLAITGNDQAKLRKAIENLEKLSFVSAITRGEVRGLTISSDVQNQIVEYATSNPDVSKQTSQLLVDLSALLNKFLPEVENNLDESWALARVCAPTVEALFAHSLNRGIPIPENEVALLNVKLGAFYREISIDIQKSLAYCERALAMYQSLYVGNHPDVAKALNSVGIVHRKLGDDRKGLDYFESALEMYRALYQGNHPGVATSLSNVGAAYCNLGDVKKGLDYFEQALAMRQALYPGDHSDVAASLDSVGAAYWNLKDFKKSLDYYERTLVMRQSLYPGNHPDVATSLNNVGVAYEGLGYDRKCLDYEERALAMRQALYQDNHPDVAASLNSVGDTYWNLKDFKKSLDYYERALAMRQALHKDNHLDIATSLNDVGVAYKKLGDVKKGLDYQERALEMRRSLHKGHHPDVAKSLHLIGLAYSTLKDYRKALDHLEPALTMRQALYQGNHPDVANSFYNVGNAYYNLEDYRKALDYYELALAMRQALYQGNHHDVAASLNSVGDAYWNLKDFKKSLDYEEHALVMRQALYQGNHHDIATSLNYVGVAYEDLGDVRKGLDYQERALTMRQALEGNKPDIATSLNSVGIAYQSLGDSKKALDCKERALDMRRALYQNNHPDIAASLNSVGDTYWNLKDFKKGLDYYERALAMRQALEGNKPDIATSLYSVGVAYEKLGDYRKALDYKERALAMRQTLKEEDDSKEEFKGQGTLSYAVDSRLEYYNSGIDRILELRLDRLGFGSNVILLKSLHITKQLGSAAGRLVKDVACFGCDGQVILAPFNLNNKHWLGLVFKPLGGMVEVTYMDSEQGAMPRKFAEELGSSLVMAGYQTRFLQVMSERQKYNNCGLEVIENFVYYLTGARATQEGAVYLHSLLVENSLLDPEEYGLRLEENNKLIGFLSNAAPVGPIRLRLDAGPARRLHAIESNGAMVVDLVPSIREFNRLCAKWLQGKLRFAQSMIHKANIGFKGLDLVVDSARLLQQPDSANAKMVVLDVSYLYSMYSGVNGYSAIVSVAETAYQIGIGEYHKAFSVAMNTLNAMALPSILAHANRPYLSFSYGVWITMQTVYNAVNNAYQFSLELMSEDATLRSTMAYKELAEWLAASPLQVVYDFEASSREYKLKANGLLVEKEKSMFEARLQKQGAFGQKLFDYDLPNLLEKYGLLNDVIIGVLTEEEARDLGASAQSQSYDHCMEIKSASSDEPITKYYCYNMVDQVFDHMTLTAEGSIMVVEHL